MWEKAVRDVGNGDRKGVFTCRACCIPMRVKGDKRRDISVQSQTAGREEMLKESLYNEAYFLSLTLQLQSDTFYRQEKNPDLITLTLGMSHLLYNSSRNEPGTDGRIP